MRWTTWVDGIVAICGFVSRTRYLKHFPLERRMICRNTSTCVRQILALYICKLVIAYIQTNVDCSFSFVFVKMTFDMTKLKGMMLLEQVTGKYTLVIASNNKIQCK